MESPPKLLILNSVLFLPMRSDYKLPILNDFLQLKTTHLSMWSKFEHVPQMHLGESWHCLYEGTEKIRMVSPVFD